MNTYKIIFAKNEILACHILKNAPEFTGESYYEQDRGYLIFAIVRAETISGAIGKCEEIINDVTGKNKSQGTELLIPQQTTTLSLNK